MAEAMFKACSSAASTEIRCPAVHRIPDLALVRAAIALAARDETATRPHCHMRLDAVLVD
jgi:hypothetical protein